MFKIIRIVCSESVLFKTLTGTDLMVRRCWRLGLLLTLVPLAALPRRAEDQEAPGTEAIIHAFAADSFPGRSSRWMVCKYSRTNMSWDDKSEAGMSYHPVPGPRVHRTVRRCVIARSLVPSHGLCARPHTSSHAHTWGRRGVVTERRKFYFSCATEKITALISGKKKHGAGWFFFKTYTLLMTS